MENERHTIFRGYSTIAIGRWEEGYQIMLTHTCTSSSMRDVSTYVYQSVTLQICQHPPLGSTDLQTKEDQLPATTTAATRTTTTPRTGNSSKLRLQSSVTCVWINFYHHGEGLPKITNLQTHPANPGPVM